MPSPSTGPSDVVDLESEEESTLQAPLVDVYVEGTVMNESGGLRTRAGSDSNPQAGARMVACVRRSSVGYFVFPARGRRRQASVQSQNNCRGVGFDLQQLRRVVETWCPQWSVREPVDVCVCNYEASSLRPKTVFGDGQHRVDAMMARILDEANDAAPHKFWMACRAFNSTRFSKPMERNDPSWYWDRGLLFAGIQFGRTRSNASQYRYLTMFLENEDHNEQTFGCNFASISECDGKLWDVASQLGSQESYDDQLCIIGGTWEEAAGG